MHFSLSLQEMSEPGERTMFKLRQNCEGGVMSFDEFTHARLISNPEAIRVAVERAPDFRCCGWHLCTCRSGIEP